MRSRISRATHARSNSVRSARQTLAPFTAGAHVDLILPNGVRRSYSLCNPQGETHRYVVGVKKASPSRGASTYLHETLRVGTEIGITPPRNNFPLVETAPHSVLIAGGIGITPIWGMIQRLNGIGASFELHYASRTRGEAAFLKDFESLDADPSRLRLTFDHEPGGKMLDLPSIVAAAPPDAHFYACGPAPMLEAFERAVRDVPGARAHLERFEGVKDAAGQQADGFEVVLARSGITLAVPPASRSSTFCSTKESTCRFPAWRASAARASSACWRAFRTIGTWC